MQRVSLKANRALLQTIAGGNPGRSPFQVFVETFKKEWGKSKELQDDMKALTDATGKMSESEAYRKAKEAYDKAKSSTSFASTATGKTLKKAGEAVGNVAQSAWESTPAKATRKVAASTVEGISAATEPIRKTAVYRDIKEVIDDGSSIRYGGFESKEMRQKRREAIEKERERLMRSLGRKVEADESAGSNVVLHDEQRKPGLKEQWQSFKEKNAIFKALRSAREGIDESDNGFIVGLRSIAEKFGSFFEETEQAKVIRMFKEIDPTFTTDSFLREMREFIIPEVLDAYVKGDATTLKRWLSEAPYNIWATGAKQYTDAGLVSAGRVLDIRGVDILSSKILPPSDIPVFVMQCRAQEIQLYKSAKTGEIAAGVPDNVQQSVYAMVVTRIPEEIDDPETHGWCILELVRGQTRDWV
ncbi:hypothetical protein CANCADRAFT_56388 [Tortispora caseinolytica NRRL Y-17796]|uniref:Mitochondrial import inner membrane translocase subunit TIM44 n=1 Tax=Tortispora caseinolytica NRRL Y-17796 TaxID=767744 RepID=A0A1E4TME8_9ASCO|nr:hypothetical protein CANCADRAFT_56388 [Tortispora caseinolytica NRRL Y-17796]